MIIIDTKNILVERKTADAKREIRTFAKSQNTTLNGARIAAFISFRTHEAMPAYLNNMDGEIDFHAVRDHMDELEITSFSFAALCEGGSVFIVDIQHNKIEQSCTLDGRYTIFDDDGPPAFGISYPTNGEVPEVVELFAIHARNNTGTAKTYDLFTLGEGTDSYEANLSIPNL